jgi:hypothetical protein
MYHVCIVISLGLLVTYFGVVTLRMIVEREREREREREKERQFQDDTR